MGYSWKEKEKPSQQDGLKKSEGYGKEGGNSLRWVEKGRLASAIPNSKGGGREKLRNEKIAFGDNELFE